jgi:hypothetical protein
MTDVEANSNELDTDRTLARCTEALRAIGNHTGRSGAAAAMPEPLVNAYAERHVQRHWNGKRNELAKRRTSAERAIAESTIVREQFIRTRLVAEQLELERNAHPHRFSLLLSGVFILISLLLFFTDFPLSLMLVGDIFGMQIRKMNEPLSNLFSSLARQSWQIMFLSIGIAIFPAVLKIPYQYFISGAEADRETSGFKRHLPAVLMGSTVVLTLATLIFLAIFRADVHNRKIAAEAFADQQTAALPAPASEQLGGIAEFSFILLTLTLPILATIAFSEGSAAIQRNRRFRRIRDEWPQLKAAHIDALMAESAAREGINTIQESMNRPEATSALREIARQKGISIYLSAHEEGRRRWIEEFSNRSLYETIVLSAGEELSPPTGNPFSHVQEGLIQ